jgi:hypothetical protein
VGVRNADDNLKRLRRLESAVGVDPDPRANADYVVTSDDFFARNTQSFDLIFIDGLHWCEQVLRDCVNAFACLRPQGCVVIHDSLPTTETHQVRENDGVSAWTGDTWKAVALFASTYTPQAPYRLYTVDVDWGCSIIQKLSNTHCPQVSSMQRSKFFTLDWQWYCRHGRTALYVIPRSAFEQWFLNGAVPIRGFWHIYLSGEWKKIVAEQLGLLVEHGLYSVCDGIEVGCVGRIADLVDLQEMLLPYRRIEVSRFEPEPAYEFVTLEILDRFARTGQSPYGFYFHTKGASRPGNPIAAHWRNILNYWSLLRWPAHYDSLHTGAWDTCGVNLLPATWCDQGFAHYSGNYWWFRADYIRSQRLPPITSLDYRNRISAEAWICSGNGKHCSLGFYEPNDLTSFPP